jgi:putative folate metabolism gamma-glutamate ligase
MIVSPVKTAKILPNRLTIFELLDKYLPALEERNIIAVTSKIVSLCEGRVVSAEKIDKDKLMRAESDYYLPGVISNHGFSFTITQNTLIPMAGIDESNGGGYHVLWPENPQKTANEIRKYLRNKFGLKNLGVVITDSTCMPMRWGVVGIALSYSGFRALNDYTKQKDLFGRPFKVSQAGVASGLAAAAVVAMGEGAEQTPIAIISDLPLVQYQNRDPSQKELELFYLKNKDDDLFAPFLNAVNWQKGRNV